MYKVGKSFWPLFTSMALLAGCITNPLCGNDSQEVRLFRTQTEFMVNQGIKNFEDSNYPAALTVFQGVVGSKSATKNEKVVAYKYMAFTYCISPNGGKESHERLCRDSFKKAFELNPAFNLSPAEAGHPVWGPIFSGVKNTQKK